MANQTEKNLEDSDVELINTYRSKVDDLIYSFGELYVNKIRLESREEQLKDELNNLTSQEEQLLTELNEKYGEGRIDLDKRKFYPLSSE